MPARTGCPGHIVFDFRCAGLDGEERWEFCNAIVKDFGLTVDRSQADWKTLIDELQGHPLMMRVVLSKLSTTTPGQLKTMLAGNLQDFLGLDTDSARMFATLKFVQDGLPADLRPWLTPLSLHERFVDADYLKEMGNRLAQPMSAGNSAVDRLMSQLTRAGLVTSIGQGLFELHPVLSRFLQQSTAAAEATESVTAWQRAFVEFMAGLADHFAPKELHEQRGVFHAFGSSFRRALSLAVDLGMEQAVAALTQSLAAFAMNTGRFQEASELFGNLAENQRKAGNPEAEAGAYHQLGRIAQEQRDFATAEQWYRKSLAIEEKQGNEHGAAITYHQLGIIAQEQRDFATAEQWYRKSLAIKEKQGNEHGAASTYHQLGIIAQEQRDFSTAEQWYRKSLAIKEKQGNEHGAASTYHQLGRIAEEQRDFATAEQWYRKSLAIREKQGNEHGAASTYHQLGRIAEEQRDFATAEQWYRKSLAIKEKQGNEHGAASTYHQLGRIAQEQRDFTTAEQWYRKSLAIFQKQGNEHGAASTYHQLGIIAQEQRDFTTAEQWYRKSLAIEEKQGNEHGAASTYHQLGRIAEEQRDFSTAEQWYRKSLAIFQKQGNEHGAAITYHQLGIIAQEQRDFATAELHFGNALSLAERTRRNDVAASSALSSAAILLASGRHIDAARLCIRGILAARRGFEALTPAGVTLFVENWEATPNSARGELVELWRSAALGPLPDSLKADQT
ncbi:MAG UNVERIFIED_CONTAM: tetratricopeptide repeat protein [Planctomycetaceae bacterium]